MSTGEHRAAPVDASASWEVGRTARHEAQEPRFTDLYTLLGPAGNGEALWFPRGTGTHELATVGGPDLVRRGAGSTNTPSMAITLDTLTAFASHVEGAVRLPDIELGMNPRRGLVAVPTWFWVQRGSYAGQELSAADDMVVTREVCDLVELVDPVSGRVVDRQRSCHEEYDTYHVEVRLSDPDYRWDFGDGASRSGSIGRVYPEPSDVTHTYQYSSLGRPTGYPVVLTVAWAASFQVSGATDVRGSLEQTRRVYGPFSHLVQEAQAVLARP